MYEYRNLRRWSDRDKKELLYRVQQVYFQLRKLGITLYKDKEAGYFVRGGRFFNEPRDWTVTLSRVDFPWRECTFKNYKRKDCL